jgi:hypothetical protein
MESACRVLDWRVGVADHELEAHHNANVWTLRNGDDSLSPSTAKIWSGISRGGWHHRALPSTKRDTAADRRSGTISDQPELEGCPITPNKERADKWGSFSHPLI